MSSDEYFDEIDSAFLQQVDAIEATHVPHTIRITPGRPAAPPRPQHRRPPSPAKPAAIEICDSDDFDSFSIDDEGLEIIDKLCDTALRGGAPVAGPNRPFSRSTSRATIQTTLFGGIVPPKHTRPPSTSRHPVSRRDSEANNGFVGDPRKTKKWDHTAFAKTGWKKPQTVKGKEKAFGSFEEEDEEEAEEPEEFVQFPAPFISLGPPPPLKLEVDRLAAKRWIYPLNQPRRDYQRNIVKRCLFDNTLVAIPTGLGKTFIAGVVMLNFYHWFPEGKVVFVAPTKPLVAQQIEACHKTCGIPGSHAAELTGQNPRAMRARAWQEKRVFYMTPQTLMNDLRTENCDPSDIVLLVIDEAHKGTGDYAYAQVVRYMMAKNPHFRILALTATPGGKPEAVQAIVDALHISHIEIRDEQSLDLAPYLHKKHIKQHIISMTEDVAKVRDLLSEVMTPIITKLFSAKLLHGNPRPVALHPYSCTRAIVAMHTGGAHGNNQWAIPMLSKLGTLCRAMGYLIECSLSLCYTALQEASSGVNATTGKQTGSKTKAGSLQKDTKLQAVLQELETLRARSGGFTVHPKMDKLRTLLVEHFAQHQFDREDRDAGGSREEDSRVMVFVSYRQCVDEVIELLNHERPLIRAVPFIGQGTDKNGKKGYGQKEQLEVIKRFKTGEFNVLVSTSIGEEGLDIGEIDMIVCYDAQKTPIRMLQRIGRTGRKRDGHVHVLLSEDREENNWDKADDNYKDVQRFIIKAEHLELYSDVERLIPLQFQPEYVEMVMDIEEYKREDAAKKKGPRSPQPPKTKRVRNGDVMRNIPIGASTTFVSVKDLLRKPKKRKKGEKEKTFEELGESDEDDHAIAAGLSHRTASMPSVSGKPRKQLKTAATMPAGAMLQAKTKKALSFQELDEDDSEDDAIIKRVSRPAPKPNARTAPKPRPVSKSIPAAALRRLSVSVRSASPSGAETHGSGVSSEPAKTTASSATTMLSAHADVVDLAAPIQWSSPPRWSSPDLPIAELPTKRMSTPTSSPPASAGVGVAAPPSMSWLLDDDDDIEIPLVGSSPSGRHARKGKRAASADSDVEPLNQRVSSPSVLGKALAHSQLAMPPPASSTVGRAYNRSPVMQEHNGGSSSPALTFAVRRPAKAVKKRLRVDSSPPLVVASPPQRRIRRRTSQERDESARVVSPGPQPKKRKMHRFADIVEAKRHNPWIDVEASQSGEDGSADEDEDGVMSEADRGFIADQATQASPSYDQAAMYRRSLMTQVPGTAPRFARPPVSRGLGAFAAASSRGRTLVSSSPPRDSEPDDYVFGSFVVADDAEVSYLHEAELSSES